MNSNLGGQWLYFALIIQYFRLHWNHLWILPNRQHFSQW